jgi:hypothetical protein
MESTREDQTMPTIYNLYADPREEKPTADS